MAVASRGAALNAFRELINRDPVEARTILRQPYLPSGLGPSDDPVRMGPATLIGGTATRRATRSAPQTRRPCAPSLTDHRKCCPAARRSPVTPSPRTSKPAWISPWRAVPPGVVYPLAVCELATDFRFRNVGGASAGAIAAALTAAAELGRSSQVLAAGGLDQQVTEHQHSSATTNGNHIRRGFTGLTDIIGWLTQTRLAIRRLTNTGSPSSSDPAGPGCHLPGGRGHAWPELATASARPLCIWMDPPLVHARPDLGCGGAHRIHGMAVYRRASYGPGDDRARCARRAGVRRHRRRCGLVLQGIRSGLRKPSEEDGETPTVGGSAPPHQRIRHTAVHDCSALVIGVAMIIPVVVLGIFRPALYASASSWAWPRAPSSPSG